ncbi:hypothetical protein ALTERO38_90172 [Alteromonas sp. 38]|nr:hypothetical protein ALTER154_10276 [Alteromonas sp. 154]VXC50614.1 hypothetical protein ALTERO38_90172 [Alteromonas sp. 38]
MSFDHNIGASYNANCIVNYLAMNSKSNDLATKTKMVRHGNWLQALTHHSVLLLANGLIYV